MGLVTVTAPEVEPITTDEAKKHLNVEHTDDDEYIAVLIEAARDQLEVATGRSWVTQTWKLTLDEFPDKEFLELPRPPLQSVTHVKYYDPNGVQQTFSNTSYKVDTASGRGRIILLEGEVWPAIQAELDVIEIEFKAGYGSAEVVPPGLKHLLKIYLGLLYAIREPVVLGTIATKIPHTIERLTWRFKSWRMK